MSPKIRNTAYTCLCTIHDVFFISKVQKDNALNLANRTGGYV